ncbi:MAG: helix-turn-helix domain-containing protein [Deltaproteobacteria bacterium]|nr:helix-turn-helix domain-containing protein [Deltaproteobacteria bacterium]
MKADVRSPANTNTATRGAALSPGESRAFLERHAFEAFKVFIGAFQDLMKNGDADPEEVAVEPRTDVMTADEVAVFLGVDRNTVYDFAGRGVIPHQRLGKRLLFRRGAIVSWLDASLCKATSTRKG